MKRTILIISLVVAMSTVALATQTQCPPPAPVCPPVIVCPVPGIILQDQLVCVDVSNIATQSNCWDPISASSIGWGGSINTQAVGALASLNNQGLIAQTAQTNGGTAMANTGAGTSQSNTVTPGAILQSQSLGLGSGVMAAGNSNANANAILSLDAAALGLKGITNSSLFVGTGLNANSSTGGTAAGSVNIDALQLSAVQ